MLYAVVFVLFFIESLDVTWGQCLTDGNNTSEEELAKQWLCEMDQTMVKVYSEAKFAFWNYEVNITQETGKLANEANLLVSQFNKEACKNASRFDWQNFTDSSLIRRFRKILYECSQLTDDEIIRLAGLQGNMTAIYSTAQVCGKRPSTSDAESQNETCLSLEPDLSSIMTISRNWEELRWAWEGWRNVSGRKMKSSFIDMVKLLNKDVKKRGYRDYGDYWRSIYETKNFSSTCDKLWRQLKPLYQQLHAYVRRKLMQSYPNNTRDFPNTRHIPAHLTGNIWAQTWDNILDMVKPFPNSSAINITKILLDHKFNALRMVREADSFFTSLGLPPMPEEFWNHSLIEKPNDGRDVVCHPANWDFHNRRDFRIKQCTEITGEFFYTTHHEMGHTQYCINYKHHPVIFQAGANPGFHEAVGDVIALSVDTPQHLRKINLLDNATDSHESDLNFLMQQALFKIAFLPFGYLIDRWRWGVFSGAITPANYNKNYWKLRCGLQGLSPPTLRSEDDFDIGSKYHIGGNYPYMSYFVSFIIQFQFHKSLCQAAGHVGPLHKCDIYQSQRAGRKLRRMMSLGSSRHWQDAMEIMTGQRNMDAGPLLEYFRPLHDWLRRQNRGHRVGWDERCPSGSFQ